MRSHVLVYEKLSMLASISPSICREISAGNIFMTYLGYIYEMIVNYIFPQRIFNEIVIFMRSHVLFYEKPSMLASINPYICREISSVIIFMTYLGYICEMNNICMIVNYIFPHWILNKIGISMRSHVSVLGEAINVSK